MSSRPYFYEGLAKDIGKYNYDCPLTIKDNFLILIDLLKKDFSGTIFWNTIGKFKVIFFNYDRNLNAILSLIVSSITILFGFPVLLANLFSRKNALKVLPFFIYLITVFYGVPNQRYGLQFMFFLSIAASYPLSSILPFNRGEGEK